MARLFLNIDTFIITPRVNFFFGLHAHSPFHLHDLLIRGNN